MKTCSVCETEKPFEDFPKDKYKQSGVRHLCKDCYNKYQQSKKHRDKQYSTKAGHARLILSGVKSRARKENIPFTIDVDEMSKDLPDFCPALGIKLSWCERKGQAGEKDTSPSLDKFHPELGYVPGNVFWISGLANKIKSKFSTDQVEAVANWMKAQA